MQQMNVEKWMQLNNCLRTLSIAYKDTRRAALEIEKGFKLTRRQTLALLLGKIPK